MVTDTEVEERMGGVFDHVASEIRGRRSTRFSEETAYDTPTVSIPMRNDSFSELSKSKKFQKKPLEKV